MPVNGFGTKSCSGQDFVESLQQLAVYPPGREALLQDSSVVEALQQVAKSGWTDEAKICAEATITALTGETLQAEAKCDGGGVGPDDKHIMMSYNWAAQTTVKRIVSAAAPFASSFEAQRSGCTGEGAAAAEIHRMV